ncbi:GNAT family N-acetyltransferase [Brevundimonas sp. Root1279]|uniref:GNAT family N-acetyltransferase n=1 Tax=Brevundimonas sp. Root1279 TaxID=1736443 RepID=UPI0012E3B9DF|nr:GNAT family N-acetyltransferase [Brevundimonas sp. Root1279]
MSQADAAFLLAFDEGGQAVGCGALRPLDRSGIGEVKRMFAAPHTRGVGSALLLALETAALEMGYRALWLSTRRVNRPAVAFYSRHGYAEIEPFGRYVNRPESVCMGRQLHR